MYLYTPASLIHLSLGWNIQTLSPTERNFLQTSLLIIAAARCLARESTGLQASTGIRSSFLLSSVSKKYSTSPVTAPIHIFITSPTVVVPRELLACLSP